MSQDKYTRSAKNKPCTVRMGGVCNHRTDTTVFAHLNGAGGGMKHSNIHGAYACYECHYWLDGGYAKHWTKMARDAEHLRAMLETQQIMIADGILIL